MADEVTLRDYQADIVEEFFKKEKYFDNILSMANMGAGKSIIIAFILKRLITENKSITVFINVEKILFQLKKIFMDLNIKFNIISRQEKRIDENVKLWLIMEQSFHQNRRELLEDNFKDIDYLVKDEYHIGADKKRFNDIIDFLKPKKVFGFTGTPFDSEGFLLNGFSLENIILKGNAIELTELGHLSPLSYIVSKHSEKMNFKNIKISSNDYSTKELENILNQNTHTDFVVNSMNEVNAKNKKTIVYTNSIKHAEAINKALLDAGYLSRCIHSKIKEEITNESIVQFKKENSKVNCLVSVSQLTTGFDAPIGELCVLLRPTKILRLYLQMIYRVARIYNGKKRGIILDLAQCVREHGFGDDFRPLLENKKSNKAIMKTHKETQINSRTKCLLDNIDKSSTLFEIDIEKFKLELREIKRNYFLNKDKKIDELFKEFNRVVEIEDIILIADEINYRTHLQKLSDDEVSKLLNISNNNTFSENKIYFFKLELNKLVRNKKFTFNNLLLLCRNI